MQSFGNILDIFKEVPGITDETVAAMQQIEPSVLNGSLAIEKLAEEYNIADERALKFLDITNKSGKVYSSNAEMMAAFNSQVRNTSVSAKLATVKVHALSIAMKALSTIGWMVIAEIVMVAAQIWNYWFEQIIDNL